MSSSIRLATAALSRRIFAGRPNKAGDGFSGERHDVTSDVLKAIAEHIGMDCEATICRDGEPAYIVTVKSIDDRIADVTAEQAALDEYLAEYEMCCDDGYYTPSEHERGLIEDAMQGWLVDRDGLVHAARAQAIEARRAETAQTGSVADESAVAESDAPVTGGHHE